MLVSIFLMARVKKISSRNWGHSMIEYPYHIALKDRKSKAGIPLAYTKHEYKAWE